MLNRNQLSEKIERPNSRNNKSGQHEAYINKFNNDFKMAPSAYARALNYLTSNDTKRAEEQLAIISTVWGRYGVAINVEESLIKMRSALKRMSNSEFVEVLPSFQKSRKFAKNPYIDNEYKSQRQRKADDKSGSITHLVSSGYANINFQFDKDSKLDTALGVKALNNFTDEEIYDSATSLDPTTVRNGGFVIEYNNVKYGGYGTNIEVNFSTKLSAMHNSKVRIEVINAYLKNCNIEINSIKNLTPIDLIKKVSVAISRISDMDLQKKEAMLETVVRRITQIMLNETDLSDNYLLSSEHKIRGRNYGHVSTAGGLINSLFSNVALNDQTHIRGTVGTDLLVRIGSADCRGTNTTYAALLNIGYEELSSPKRAKLFYAKMSHGTTADDFNNSNPEDHNIVLVKEQNGSVVVRDAYFEHVDSTPLRMAITGHIKQGDLISNENEVLGKRKWGFQIPGCPPYPAQQRLMTKEQRLKEEYELQFSSFAPSKETTIIKKRKVENIENETGETPPSDSHKQNFQRQ